MVVLLGRKVGVAEGVPLDLEVGLGVAGNREGVGVRSVGVGVLVCVGERVCVGVRVCVTVKTGEGDRARAVVAAGLGLERGWVMATD